MVHLTPLKPLISQKTKYITTQILFFYFVCFNASPLFLGMFCAVPDAAGPPSPNGHRDQHDGHHYLGHWQGGETHTWNK